MPKHIKTCVEVCVALAIALQITGCYEDPPLPAADVVDTVDTVDTAGPSPCIALDRVTVREYPPAGVHVTFRVLGCDGYPVRPLLCDGAICPWADVTVLNDEKGEPFGAGQEGGGASAPGVPSDFGLYAILALDMSDSIINNGMVDVVFDGAASFIDEVVARPAPELRHKVAVLVFGRTDATELVVDFTDDVATLESGLAQLRLRFQTESLGTTNLYGAYETALELVRAQGAGLSLVERSVVLFTDGTHEAGNEAALRAQALGARDAAVQAGVTIFGVAVQGAYDEQALRELASLPDYFVATPSSDTVDALFQEVAQQLDQRVLSNYAVGVCTPVELGNPSLTVQVVVDALSASTTVRYATTELTGDVAACDEASIANPCQGRVCGEGAFAGSVCGRCAADKTCDANGQCVAAP